MMRVRFPFLILLAAAGFALASMPARVFGLQPDKGDVPLRPSQYNKVSEYKSAGGLSDPAKAKEAFAAFAKYQADYVASPRVYTAPQEFTLPGTSPAPYTPEDLIREINRHILVPLPTSKVNRHDADYMRELGNALDAALKEKIESGEPIVRINAMRLLAAACRSGATVHYGTLTGIITNANTPPAVKHYAYEAAGNLLAAYDFNDYRSRKHTGSAKEVGGLIAAIQDSIVKPEAAYPTLFPKAPPAAKGEKAPAGGNLQSLPVPVEEQKVILFLRRSAVRALSQCRFAEGPQGGEKTYPAFTLARIAVSDPAIFPPPSTTEVAEAVIGICNMTPPRAKGDAEQYGYAMTDAVATGIIAFARPRAGNPSDKSLPWRGYAARLIEALNSWQPLFDPAFDPERPTVFSPTFVPRPVQEMAKNARDRVLAPMDGTLTKIDVQGLADYRDNSLRSDKKWTLAPFKDRPDLVLPRSN